MILAANFKTNHTREETKIYLQELEDYLQTGRVDIDTRVYPPFTALTKQDDFLKIKLGAQNFYPIKNGSVTGEIGLEQLDEFEIDSVLIGHSERRVILKESQDIVADKFNFAKNNNLEIIYCIGEPLEVREEGFSKVLEYLFSQFDGIDISYKKLVIAYEPIWAIGTGKSATIKDIEDVLKALKEKVLSPILYGGSVNVENIASIISLHDCDGVLVGSASLDVKNFCNMIEQIKNIK